MICFVDFFNKSSRKFNIVSMLNLNYWHCLFFTVYTVSGRNLFLPMSLPYPCPSSELIVCFHDTLHSHQSSIWPCYSHSIDFSSDGGWFTCSFATSAMHAGSNFHILCIAWCLLLAGGAAGFGLELESIFHICLLMAFHVFYLLLL